RARDRPAPRPTHTRRGPGGRPIRCPRTLAPLRRFALALALAQPETLDLAGGGLGQLGDELEQSRVLVGRELALHEVLELLLELRRRRSARLEDDEGLRAR